jgi:GDPmannose 4,6-dehydratase
MKTALITGVTGQDGSYLAELLLEKGYEVHGLIRRTSTPNTERLSGIEDSPKFNLVYGDLDDSTSSISNIIRKVNPHEIYNLGAQSHVRISFDIPESTGIINGIGVTRILEAVRNEQESTGKQIKFYQASTSELFGKIYETPQSEKTAFHPRSPYAVSKLYAYWMTRNYRDGYDMFACNGILFNHESPRRGEEFVTRKITKGVAEIKKGLVASIELGNLDAKRDWGHAKDYVNAMYLMLQQDKPDDYVIATGESHSVREFLEKAFDIAEIPVESNGKKGLDEEYLRTDTGQTVVRINPKYFRPTEVNFLLGDSSKAKRELAWTPEITFEKLAEEMVKSDLKNLKH